MTLYGVDNNKRGKLISVAILVSSIVVLSKLVQQSEVVNLYSVVANAFIISIISYIGLLWALSFQITLRSMVYALSQSSLIVFILTIFLEIFVFRRVGRVYEVLILLTLSGVMFFVTYASYLMANIFNVAHFKEIPLTQVAKTTSLLLSLLSIYFISFAIFEMSLSGYVTITLLGIVYFFIILFHLRHLGINRNNFWRSFYTVFFYTLLISSLYILIGGNPLIFSIVPTVVSYSLINLLTLENTSISQKYEYFILTIVSILLVIFIQL